jgi:hypothetical protein
MSSISTVKGSTLWAMAPESSTLKKGARVVLIDDLPGVSAGTTGKVGRSIGVKTTRYRVRFDNGVDVLSVSEAKLVSPAAWEFIKAAPAATSGGPATSTVAAAVPVAVAPTALMAPDEASPSEPSTQATEPPPPAKKSTPESGSDAASATDDPRLAALTAKSRDARKAAGIDVDAEEVPPPADPVSTPSVEQAAPAATSSEPQAGTPPGVTDLPDGYYPPDNRIADLLASIKRP